MKFKNRRPLPRARIEIIPMIDTIFFLLVFFMLSSLSMTRLKGLPVDLPDARTAINQPASDLSLTIDARGRVTSVTAVGAADGAFLEAARRHIVRHWRYQPASESGTAVASTITVSLTFTLEE